MIHREKERLYKRERQMESKRRRKKGKISFFSHDEPGTVSTSGELLVLAFFAELRDAELSREVDLGRFLVSVFHRFILFVKFI